ncbi:leucine-rich repeat protein soc-2 homolog [Chelonus insularis]|uniref:leucine-rich repeat protein soc-2 homolog n=1 Tax=Chelonus insularis TaxID=460826 RepID=UPI00158AD5FB|nr:leucine-rich repeat protein soc-2 homolog [Chelonus insularis]
MKIFKALLTLHSRHDIILDLDMIEKLKTTQELDLTQCKLIKLPPTILQLTALKTLILDDNQILHLPKAISEMLTITKFSIANNGLSDFPCKITNLTNLVILNISGNKLKSLPDYCKKLENLQVLDISKNELKCIPRCIQRGLANLKILDVSKNEGMSLNGRIFSKKLKELYVRNNGLVQANFPGWLFFNDITEYDVIDFEYTCFEVITIHPAKRKIKIKKLNLEQSYLNDRLLSIILKNIESVNYLRIGNVSGRYLENSFTAFPKEFNNPKDVRELKINQVGLSVLSKTIGSFLNLTKLELQDNSISWLPDEIVNLKRLEILIIDNNSLMMLPENIGYMGSLKIISAPNNSISSLPESIRYLKSIEYIDLYCNYITDLPNLFHSTLIILKGLDLEQNTINTNNFQLPASYESLRNQLGSDNNDLKLRSIGPRVIQATSDESRNSSFHEHISSDSNKSSSYNSDQSQNNWNTEYDSSDDFDPFGPPKVLNQREAYIMQDKMQFCPADIHPRRIREILASKIGNKKYRPFTPVEGQFDDAE